MKFEINNREWEIIELSQKEMFEIQNLKQEESIGQYYGLTRYSKQTIYLWNDLCEEQKKQTLYHELMHCYIGMYCSYNRETNYLEEEMCDISANSHDIIHKIVEDYFKRKNNDKN